MTLKAQLADSGKLMVYRVVVFLLPRFPNLSTFFLSSLVQSYFLDLSQCNQHGDGEVESSSAAGNTSSSSTFVFAFIICQWVYE